MYRLLVAILLGCIMYPAVSFARTPADVAEKPEFVLILSSYSYEKEWSTTLAKEIRNYLEKNNPTVKVNITYAGIEARTSFIADRFAMQGAFASGRLNNKIILPDVLVLVGDESWMLYRIMNHRGVWGKVPVVLCGVHAEVLDDYSKFFPDKLLADSSFIPLQASASRLVTTAVIEQEHSLRTLRLARTLVPGLRHLYFLSDGSYADCYMRDKLAAASRRKDVPFSEIRIDRGNENSVEDALDKLPAESVIVTNGVPVPEGVQVPVLTLRDGTYGTHTPAGGYFAPVSAFANKAGEAICHILQTGRVGDIPYCTVPDTAFYLNETALMHAGLRSAAGDLPDVVGRNIPPVFIIRHIRLIVALLVILIVGVFVACRIVYSQRYRRNLNFLFERYKTLYNEYQVVYENMPVGLMLCDIYGNLLKRNAETDVFFEHFAHSKSDLFHLFDSGIVDENMRESLLRKELVGNMVHLEQHCYRLQCCVIADEETSANQILVIVIDNTEIEKERKAKEEITHVLNFAMNKAVIGVAEYNLVDGFGFATDAWYDILDRERGTTDFSEAHRQLVPEDREKVARYLEQVRCGVSRRFLDSLKMRNTQGELHYVRYLIQPLEYVPDRKNIIVAEIIFNMDGQIAKEKELEAAKRKAEKADRFKNAFVANMQDEIRVPLQEVISCARELVATDDVERRTELNARIEAGNDRMLKLLGDIIDLSKIELNE